MKELWTANPFCLMNRPFAEMGYNSSGLNIAPERLLLATRRPSTHHPLASGKASFNPPPARHLPTRHKPSATHGTTSGDPPPQAICRRSAQHLAAPCTASAISLRAILWPLRRIRRLSASHPPSRRKPSAIARHSIRRPPRVTRWHPAGICWHEPMPLTARRANRRRKQEP